jgi:hypothetical protein
MGQFCERRDVSFKINTKNVKQNVLVNFFGKRRKRFVESAPLFVAGIDDDFLQSVDMSYCIPNLLLQSI